MIRRAILAVVALLYLTAPGVAQPLIFPTLTGRVVDEAGLLSADDRAVLTASLSDLEARTTEQMVVVTLKSLQGTAIEDYGYQLGRRWKIGQKDKDSGVLLIVAAAERKVRIEVGYGLEGTLTDAATKLIIESAILPAFKTGDFAGGIKSGAEQISLLLRGDAGSAPPAQIRAPGPSGSSGTNMPVWLVIVLGVGGVGLLIYCAVAGGAACRWVMQILFVLALSGRGGSSRGRSSSFSGGGGSFGGGGSSGSW